MGLVVPGFGLMTRLPLKRLLIRVFCPGYHRYSIDGIMVMNANKAAEKAAVSKPAESGWQNGYLWSRNFRCGSRRGQHSASDFFRRKFEGTEVARTPIP